MLEIISRIYLYSEGRKTPFSEGYRPLFQFPQGELTSGSIHLRGQDQVCPGEVAVVSIIFLNRERLGPSFGVGCNFTFGEGATTLGEGIVLSVAEGRPTTSGGTAYEEEP